MKAAMIFGGVTVTAEGDAKECFTELASAAEVFGNQACGACGSELIVPSVREVDGNTYYEMRCQSCGSVLGFGQRKIDGRLYPRRKDKDGNWLENRGWQKFSRKNTVAASSDDNPF
jgi:hypothetical protein